MAEPVVVITNYLVKEGRRDAFGLFLGRLFDLLEANVPGLLACLAYLDEERAEASLIQVHVDA